MKIKLKDLTDLEDAIVDEINYNHNEFPGGCELKTDKASSNIIDLFTIFLTDRGVELTKQEER